MINTLSRIEKDKVNFNNKYVSFPLKKIENIENQLLKIFNDEMKSDLSVIISYNPLAIKKMARFITGDIKRSASIGVAGETASGKSTITFDIINTIEHFAKVFDIEKAVTRVNTDDYYYDRSEQVKLAGGMAEFIKQYDFDIPEALELDLMYKHINQLLSGNSVMLPKYDMSGTTIRYDNCQLAEPSKIIISEGLFTLTEKIRNAFDFKIYVDIDSNVQKDRYFLRANERGLGESAILMYEKASENASIYIRPCRENADIVLSGESDRERYKIFLSKILAVVEQYHFQKV